ncbi:MAG: response regulator [Ruminiclostridium sp.]|nr:response regulator [Ruminiclostridium sp.]
MSFKILITGKNRQIIASDISRHIENDVNCEVIGCQPLKSELMHTVLTERPRVILILLRDESPTEVRVYDLLRDYMRAGSAAVIVISNEEDKKTFMFNTGLEKMLFLPRQFSLSVLCDKLREFKNVLAEEKEESYFFEFENTAPAREFERKHILVVDDDPQQLFQIKDQLKEFYEVTAITSGTLVARVLERYKVDLIFLDYLMPKMNGPEVMAMVRGDMRYADIPIVFLTGVAEKETVIKTITEYRPQGYLLKPTKKSEIVAKVIDILG